MNKRVSGSKEKIEKMNKSGSGSKSNIDQTNTPSLNPTIPNLDP